jgi:hypothetical protein
VPQDYPTSYVSNRRHPVVGGIIQRISNRRQVASYAGKSVSKAGNPHLRTIMIQLAWLWLRHRPRSILSLWFHQRVQLNGGRVRKVLIVAVARKLLIAFWRYVAGGGGAEVERLLPGVADPRLGVAHGGGDIGHISHYSLSPSPTEQRKFKADAKCRE